jgi:hypothetical protein
MYVAKKESVKLDGNSKKTKNNTLTSVEIDDNPHHQSSGKSVLNLENYLF